MISSIKFRYKIQHNSKVEKEKKIKYAIYYKRLCSILATRNLH
jgi:hypothetical protein